MMVSAVDVIQCDVKVLFWDARQHDFKLVLKTIIIISLKYFSASDWFKSHS